VLLPLSFFAGCSAILGDFDTTPGDGGAGDGSATPDGGSGLDTSPAGDTSLADTSAADATADSVSPVDSSANDSSTLDAGGDTSPVDPCTTAPTSAVYVNGSTGSDSANNGGAPTCAFKTITAAIAAAPANATIHVAAGTYAAGETFPLVLANGRSLVGAGASTTTIQGSSAQYTTSSTNSFFETSTKYFVTILAGDAPGDGGVAPITVSGFTVLPTATVTSLPPQNSGSSYVGLACIQGNGPTIPATPPLPAPNLILQGMTFGPNFDTGVALGAQPTQETGCNALVKASTFTGSNTGLATGVCGVTNAAGSWPSAQIGDGTAVNENTFSACGIDVFVNGCGGVQSLNMNKFDSGYRGIVAITPPAQYIEILNNVFTGGSTSFPMGYGIQTNTATQINKLNGNKFTNITESSAADTYTGETTGYAVMVAQVLQAHTNFIVGNDNGLVLQASPVAGFNFSSDGVATQANQIYCNSKSQSSATFGYDVTLKYANGTAANLAGNVYDHATPSTGTSLTASANGTDVVTGTSAGATLTGSTGIGVFLCPNGHVQ
jgi:hypothetical protein